LCPPHHQRSNESGSDLSQDANWLYDSEMSASERDPKIQPIDPTRHNPCHCGAKAKWTASLRLEGAQISPSFQHQDLCKEHAQQFAAVHKLRFPPTDQPSASESERP